LKINYFLLSFCTTQGSQIFSLHKLANKKMQLFHLIKFKEYKIQQFPQKFQRLKKSSRFLLSLQKIELVKKIQLFHYSTQPSQND